MSATKILINRNYLTYQEVIRNEGFLTDCKMVWESLNLYKIKKRIEGKYDTPLYNEVPAAKQTYIDVVYQNETESLISDAINKLIAKHNLEQLDCKNELISFCSNNFSYSYLGYEIFNSDITLHGEYNGHHHIQDEIRDYEIERNYPLAIRFGTGTTTGALKKFIDDNKLKIRELQKQFPYSKDKTRNSKTLTLEMRDFIFEHKNIQINDWISDFNTKFKLTHETSLGYTDLNKYKNNEIEKRARDLSWTI